MEMTKEQRKEKIFELIMEYAALSDEKIDLDKIIEQATEMVDKKSDS